MTAQRRRHTMFSTMIVAVAIGVSSPATAATAGGSDRTFGGDGTVTTDVFGGFDDAIDDIAIQTDGKIVAVGSRGGYASRSNFAITRYDALGDLDDDFGSAGRTLLDFDGDDDFGQAVAVQPDGKIVVAGSTRLGGRSSDFAIARYNPDGRLDPTFAGNGKAATDFGGQDWVSDIAIQSDGKIVVAGTNRYGYPRDCDVDVAVARYRSDGRLDTTFSYDGKTVTGVGCSDYGNGVAIQPDGRIVVVGDRIENDSDRCFGCLDSDLIAVRYRSDGSLDATFDGDGKWSRGLGGFEGLNAVAVQQDGRLVTAGYLSSYEYDDGRTDKFYVQRSNPSGSLDDSFFGRGWRLLDVPGAKSVGHDVVLDRNGRIILAGTSFSTGTTGWNFAVARLAINGQTDTTFSSDGFVTSTFGGDDRGRAVALQSDGKIVVGGVTRPRPEEDADFALIRYHAVSD